MYLEFRVTKKSEMKHLRPILFGVFMFIVYVVFMVYTRGMDDINIYIIIGLFLLLIYSVPACILYLKYYSLNANKVMTYEPNELKITITDIKKQTEVIFTLNDIKHIYHTMTAAMEGTGLHLFSWSEYNYSIIYLNNGKKYTITSLMVYRLELPVGNRYKVMTSFYPYPK